MIKQLYFFIARLVSCKISTICFFYIRLLMRGNSVITTIEYSGGNLHTRISSVLRNHPHLSISLERFTFQITRHPTKYTKANRGKHFIQNVHINRISNQHTHTHTSRAPKPKIHLAKTNRPSFVKNASWCGYLWASAIYSIYILPTTHRIIFWALMMTICWWSQWQHFGRRDALPKITNRAWSPFALNHS